MTATAAGGIHPTGNAFLLFIKIGNDFLYT